MVGTDSTGQGASMGNNTRASGGVPHRDEPNAVVGLRQPTEGFSR